jgi:hypothetical protein
MKKMIKKYSLILGIAWLFIPNESLFAQFSLSGELRPRAEYRHGFGGLVTNDAEAAFFVSQRSRINANYKHGNIRFGMSLQDVRVWGDLPQLARAGNSLMMHQFWGEYFFTQKFSVKFGRQELVYDDARIFGNVDWAQQARAHDVALFKYEANFKLHIGMAYNQLAENKTGSNYDIASYKSLQFLWYNRKMGKLEMSVLLLNNGLQYDYVKNGVDTYKTVYSQTLGGRLNYALQSFTFHTESYYTTGKDANDRDLDAYLFKLGGNYHMENGIGLLAGWELLSGTGQDKDVTADGFSNQSFTPFYGTNHKFNGHMDYFYVSNHANSVGLSDLHAGFTYSKAKYSTRLVAHFFNAAATILNTEGKAMDNSLGTEIDFSVNYKLADKLTLSAGYSQMFGTETLQQLKGGDYKAINNWAWLMLTFKPVFL